MNQRFFRANRQSMLRVIKNEPIILCGNNLMQRKGDTAYLFEQEANFWYLTGIEHPGWSVIIEPKRISLVRPDTDAVHQVFDGSLSDSKALTISGADVVISKDEAKKLFSKLSEKYSTVWTLGKDPRAKYYDFSLNPAPEVLRRTLKRTFAEVKDCRKELAQLRAIKQPVEIKAIREAVKLTVDAFQDFYKNRQSFQYEYEAEAHFTHYFRSRGAKGHAYDPIVATGKNACTLHYNTNNQALEKNEFLLLDIGAQVQGYAADITRTYAMGKPSSRHQMVHAAVVRAHQQIVALLKPGLRVADYIDQVDQIMKQELEGLGLLKQETDYRKYFPHAVSHGLGIDVHDSLGGPETFKAGMILTVEPGIYIPEEGIGVRIEDDILITKNGHENLSAELSTSL